MSSAPTLAPDAAMVLGIASTALPFARTPDDEAERWLRVLRLHGRVGVALQALGVSEVSLVSEDGEAADGTRAGGEPPRQDAVARIAEDAAGIASRRGATGVATTDLLIAVMRVYGPAFDRVLRAHGTDRDEVLARLGVEMPADD
ncbi:MAG: hypothetical protein E6G34_02100 [Actinobacteria bacterium]|nr:MAG: hypothetical protein E6G34_02100 [Actinomycetota bacterium]